ncbi:MAG: MarR family transcriptional regulator, partial [Crocinitomicaceae bacterium]|nr:MarR family transcriptional regulator [Crocinitomicaceae bacterium]
MKPEETIDFHIRWSWAKMSKTYNSAMQSALGATMPMGYALLSIDKEGTLSTKLGPK